MFRYVTLKNFKSFNNITFNMLDKRNKPKKLILIYGENGIGKSNLASAFFALSDTLNTMNVRDFMEKILTKELENIKNDERLLKMFKEKFKDIETLIKENKTVDSKENMYMEFGFEINGNDGVYILEFDNNQIINEKLIYKLVDRKTVYFDLNRDKYVINTKIFNNSNALKQIKNSVIKFWGKHSLLSILLYESEDKSSSFIKEQITDNFDDVLHFFSSLSCKIKFGSRTERGMISLTKQMIPDYDSGTIDKKNEHLLVNAQNMLNIFFKETYRDIENVYYKKTYTENDSINYQLILQKRIGGKLRDIDFSLESTGTQALLQQLPFMLVAVNGNVAVIDEFDTGIHDLLVESILTSIVPSIKGQLILTTHNTILMESALSSDYIYVINELKDGNKEINCVLHYDPKIGERNNRRKQYLFGKYSGVPDNARIDFNKLLDTIKEEEIIDQYEIPLD